MGRERNPQCIEMCLELKQNESACLKGFNFPVRYMPALDSAFGHSQSKHGTKCLSFLRSPSLGLFSAHSPSSLEGVDSKHSNQAKIAGSLAQLFWKLTKRHRWLEIAGTDDRAGSHSERMKIHLTRNGKTTSNHPRPPFSCP